MARFRMFVLDQLLVFMFHDALLDLELRTIRRHLRPKIPPLPDVNTQLQQIYLRPLPRHLDGVEVLHLRGKKQIPYAITQLLSPFLWFHELTSRFIEWSYTMKLSKNSLADYLPFDLSLALADPSNPCQGGLESEVKANQRRSDADECSQIREGKERSMRN